MRIAVFVTVDKQGHLNKTEWYIEESMRHSAILKKVETFLRVNELVCYMSLVKLYKSQKDLDREHALTHNRKSLVVDYLSVGTD